MCWIRRRGFLAVLACCVAAGLVTANAAATELSEADLNEIRRIDAALADGLLPQPPAWVIRGSASEEGQEEFEQLGYPSDGANLESVVCKAGGWAEYKANAAALLKSKDLAVRKVMAIWVADLGEPAYVPDLWELLHSEPTADEQQPYADWARENAAVGLGVLNAQEHLSDLEERLHDASPDIRAGAARGLSWMKATQCAPEIAALLSDHHDEVACAAIEALGRLNATQYIDQIGKLATDQSVSYQQNFVAMQVLVAFDAKEWAGEIAKLMEENDAPMVRGRAMLFVALLDGQEFAGMIAKYLDDYDVKEEAAMALGILGQTQYADKIAAHLRVNNYPSTRQAVVFSLIMMESAEYAGPATRAYREADMERNHLLGKAGAASERRLKKRFEASMKKLKEGRPSTEGP